MKFVLPAIILILLISSISLPAQMITGVWKGRIKNQKIEVKIIQKGDSLTGTSYYFESASNYRRYSIKGYFDVNTNEAVWWDDELLLEHSGRAALSGPDQLRQLSRADFNCPGEGRMLLDGKTGKINDQDLRNDIHLNKVDVGLFNDEWDGVIDNYLVGANDPDVIDSVQAIAKHPNKNTETVFAAPVRPTAPRVIIEDKNPPAQTDKPVIATPLPETVEQKFVNRKKTFVKEIPISGDSIELRFYDNAEVDGDSISLFLNNQLIFEHIRLTEKAYTIKLAVNALSSSNELTMVAENLGSIPPNTSYMVVMVGEDRYDARLESTEGSSAMVRFVKRTAVQ